jgi:hypothetical protein
MFNKNCPYRKRKNDGYGCYHQLKHEIRKHEMGRWPKRVLNHVYYIRQTELCKGRPVTTRILQAHLISTLVGVGSNYRNVLRSDYYNLAK